MDGIPPTRKSCDLCYRRKLKCDGQKPHCSNCIMYDKDCTYTARSRTPAPKRRCSDRNDEMTVSNMQGRLGQLEALVQQMSERLDVAEKRHEVEPLLRHENVSGTARMMPLIGIRSDDDKTSPKVLNLPSLDLVLPVVQIYLRDFNTILPLFHAGTLLRLTHGFYNVGPPQRDPMVWAAINVVLALARRHHLVTGYDIPSVTVCLSRAESVLSRLVLGDNIQLLNIQVLVGMVMLLQVAQDIKPALILIATTIRLAHEIGLHDQTRSAHLDAPQIRQRAYVFWLAYVLDKDLGMRSKQASIQIDDDINLELPSPTVLQPSKDWSDIDSSDDPLGVMTTTDGVDKLNYFTARIQLATIEGAVYDYIHSTRSRKRSPEERSHALQSVASALEQWKASIPSEFTASAGSRRVAPHILRFLRALHSTSLTCTTLIYQAHAWDVEWVASVRRYGSQGIQPLLPPKWEVLVGEARDLLSVCGALGEFDRLDFWETGCSYVTSLVLLMANNMHQPKHDDLSLDNYLVQNGLRTMDQLVTGTENEMLQCFQATLAELHQLTQRGRAEPTVMSSIDSSRSA